MLKSHRFTIFDVDRIAKMIPFLDITDEAIKQNKELKKEYESKEEVKTLIDLSKKFEVYVEIQVNMLLVLLFLQMLSRNLFHYIELREQD